MDGEHVLRIDRPSDKGGDRDGREHQQEAAERKRKREAELLEGQAGDARERLGVPGLRPVGKPRDVGPGEEPGRGKLHADAEGQRREPPPRTHQAHPRECDGEGKGDDKAHERRVVRLRAVEVVEEDHHRDVAEEEESVHQRAEEKRARRDDGELRREREEAREYPVGKRRHRDDALQREERGHHQRVEAPEGDVAHPRLGEDKAGGDESAADRADREHDHLPLAEGRERVHSQLPVRDDSGDERIRERLREPLQQQWNVEARDAPNAEHRLPRFVRPHLAPHHIARRRRAADLRFHKPVPDGYRLFRSAVQPSRTSAYVSSKLPVYHGSAMSRSEPANDRSFLIFPASSGNTRRRRSAML